MYTIQSYLHFINEAVQSATASKEENYEVGDEVIYLLQGGRKENYDTTKKPEEQTGICGVGKIKSIVDDKFVIDYGNEGKNTEKVLAQLVGKTNASKPNEKKNNSVKAAKVLGKIKSDEEKMGLVAKFGEFIQQPANSTKVEQIKKILSQ